MPSTIPVAESKCARFMVHVYSGIRPLVHFIHSVIYSKIFIAHININMLHVLLLSVSCCFCPSCLFRGKKKTSLSSSCVCTDSVSKADSNRFWYIFVNTWLGCYFLCIIFQHFMQRFSFWVGLRGVALWNFKKAENIESCRYWLYPSLVALIQHF